MAEYNELVEALRYLVFERLQKRGQFVRGLLGDGRGRVSVPGRPDFSYARPGRQTTAVFEVFNKEVAGPDGWPVLIGELPWQPGLTQVVGTDWEAYTDAGWAMNSSLVGPHARQHEWPDTAPGTDPVAVYRRALAEMKTIAVGSGSFGVQVSPYDYDYGVPKSWPGSPSLDLAAAVPATGTSRLMLTYLDPVSNAIGVVTGTVGVHSAAVELSRPTLPTGAWFPSAYVQLYGGQSSILERDIRDARRLFSGGLATGTASHNLLSVPHSDTLAAAPLRGDLIVGNVTPAWTKLALGGASGSILTRDVTDPLWSAYFLAGTAGQTYTFPAVSGGAALGAGTLTVATANDAAVANHTHAITTSSNPGAAASILASSGAGLLQLVGLGVAVAPVANILMLPDGAVGAPCLSFAADPDSGLYRFAADKVAIAAGGVLAFSAMLGGATRAIKVGDDTNSAQLYVAGAASNIRDVCWATGAAMRWIARCNDTAEAGADAGSDFQLLAYDDAGALLSIPLQVTRSTGVATFSANPVITNAAPSLALTDTTALAKSLTIAVDADVADLRESAGAAGSLLVLDLANNRVGVRTNAPADYLTIFGGTSNINIGGNIGGGYNGIWLNGGIAAGNYNFASSSGDPALYINRPTGANINFQENNVNQGVIQSATGNLGMGTYSPDRRIHSEVADAVTNAVTHAERLTHICSTGATGLAAGGGVGLEFELETATDGTNQIAATDESLWVDATNATRKARRILYIYDTAAREGLRIEASGAAPMIGFLGAAAVVRPTALTAQLTTITHTAPGTPDYAIQDFVDVSLGAGWAFKDHDEANSVLKALANLQIRMDELEDKLGHTAGLGLITH